MKDTFLKHPRHVNIQFEENHPKHGRCYTYKGGQEIFTGYSALVGRFKNRFEADKIANGVAAKMRKQGISITADQVKAKWALKRDAANLYGNLVHEEIEHFHNTGELLESDIIDKFIELTMDLEHVGAEFVIYNEHIKSATQIDDVFTDGEQIFLFDFKTNKKIETEGFKGQMMHHPLDHLPDCNFSHYSLQLNLERHWLEKYYDIPVSPLLRIVRFWTPFVEDWDDDEEICKIYEVPDLQAECQLIEDFVKQ